MLHFFFWTTTRRYMPTMSIVKSSGTQKEKQKIVKDSDCNLYLKFQNRIHLLFLSSFKLIFKTNASEDRFT